MRNLGAGKLFALALFAVAFAYGDVVTFTGTESGALLDSNNWDLGYLPTNGVHTGIVPDGSGPVTFPSADIVDSFDITFQGDTAVSSPTSGKRVYNNVNMTFQGSSTYDNGGKNLTLADSAASGNVQFDSSGTFSNIGFMELGDAGLATFDQSAGTVSMSGAIQMEGNNAVYTLSGGTLETLKLVNFASGAYFNFTSDSTGAAVFANDGNDYTSALEGLITAGNIRIDGASATTGDFNIDYDGSTTTMTIPEPATLGLMAALGGSILFMRRLMI